jgi:transcriptional regulator with XRE-family HTH domain
MRGRILVGRNIRRIRVAKGIAQERLAFDAGVDRSYLGGMERGEENPTVDVLDRVAATLAVPVGNLFAELGAGDDLPSLPRGRKGGTKAPSG